jgi:RNA polymerase sigma-70 factor (ECF subfamily)
MSKNRKSGKGINVNPVDDQKYEYFLKLFMENQSKIYGFIMRLLPNYAVADDILQETLIIMWQKFPNFKQGTDFYAWAKQIIRFKVMSYIRRNQKRPMVNFSEEVIEKLSVQEYSHVSNNVYDEALHNCIDKLKGSSRELIRMRYVREMNIQQIATKLNATYSSVAKHMSRVHHSLKNCISKTLIAWDLDNE